MFYKKQMISHKSYKQSLKRNKQKYGMPYLHPFPGQRGGWVYVKKKKNWVAPPPPESFLDQPRVAAVNQYRQKVEYLARPSLLFSGSRLISPQPFTFAEQGPVLVMDKAPVSFGTSSPRSAEFAHVVKIQNKINTMNFISAIPIFHHILTNYCKHS